MTKNLTINDYKRVLEYYKISLPMTNSLIKNAAEQILANKLCRCIKKVDKNNEKRAIGVCTKTIFNSKCIFKICTIFIYTFFFSESLKK